jgi:CRP/FNR family transcriptional regulator, cyclic AMP receptor protein
VPGRGRGPGWRTVPPPGTLVTVQEAGDVLAGLSRSYLFEGMTRAEIGPLAAAVTTRRFVRGEYVCHLADPADEIYVVLSGEVKDSVVDADGYEVIHFVHGPGMTFGEPGYFAVERTRIVEVIAVQPSTLIRLGRRVLAPFMECHVNVKDRALEGLASNTRWQTTMISSQAKRPLTDRLLLRLLELTDSGAEQTSGHPVTPKISQSTLAAMVGVSRENVNRALAELMTSGLIRQDRGRYVLLDEERLRRQVARDWPLAARRDRRIDPAGP